MKPTSILTELLQNEIAKEVPNFIKDEMWSEIAATTGVIGVATICAKFKALFATATYKTAATAAAIATVATVGATVYLTTPHTTNTPPTAIVAQNTPQTNQILPQATPQNEPQTEPPTQTETETPNETLNLQQTPLANAQTLEPVQTQEPPTEQAEETPPTEEPITQKLEELPTQEPDEPQQTLQETTQEPQEMPPNQPTPTEPQQTTTYTKAPIEYVLTKNVTLNYELGEPKTLESFLQEVSVASGNLFHENTATAPTFSQETFAETGEHVLKIYASDVFQGADIEITASINVADTTPPTIEIGNKTQTHPKGEPLTLETVLNGASITIQDHQRGSIEPTTTGFEAIDTTAPGRYILSINATDESGNTAQQKIIYVNIT